jgi:two-component system NarL family response regulator
VAKRLTEADNGPNADPGSLGGNSIRVLVADDDPLARQMICEQLAADGVRVVGQAGDGDQAVEMALELRPDLVVMDLLMPGCDGITATQRIAVQAPEVQVVILSVSEDDEAVMMALRSGAVGFLHKGIEMDALLRVVRGVHRGEAALDRSTTRRLIQEFRAMATRTEAMVVGTQAAGSQLTRREQQILGLLAAGLTTEGISTELKLAVETVRTHIKGILRKLQVHSRQEAIEIARARGAVAPPNPGGFGSALGATRRGHYVSGA